MGPCAMNKICLATLTISYTFCSILNLRWKNLPYPDPGPGLFFFIFLCIFSIVFWIFLQGNAVFFCMSNIDKPDFAKTLQGHLFCLFVDVYFVLIFARNKISEVSLIIDSTYIFIKIEMVFCYQNCSDLLWEKNCSIRP